MSDSSVQARASGAVVDATVGASVTGRGSGQASGQSQIVVFHGPGATHERTDVVRIVLI